MIVPFILNFNTMQTKYTRYYIFNIQIIALDPLGQFEKRKTIAKSMTGTSMRGIVYYQSKIESRALT